MTTVNTIGLMTTAYTNDLLERCERARTSRGLVRTRGFEREQDNLHSARIFEQEIPLDSLEALICKQNLRSTRSYSARSQYSTSRLTRSQYWFRDLIVIFIATCLRTLFNEIAKEKLCDHKYRISLVTWHLG